VKYRENEYRGLLMDETIILREALGLWILGSPYTGYNPIIDILHRGPMKYKPLGARRSAGRRRYL